MTTRSGNNKQQRSAALAKHREARGRCGNAFDEVDDGQDDDDIYEYMDEEAYTHLVESRREREDFVVDDDGIGYHDDGEERFGDEAAYNDDDTNKKKRSVNANAALTSAALSL
jgi:hypothetical protein